MSGRQELDPLKGGLKHNPFAALRAKAEGGKAALSGQASEPTNESSKSSSLPRISAAQSAHALPAAAAKSAARSAPAERSRGSHAATTDSSGAAAIASRKPATTAPHERVTVRIERTRRGGKTVTIVEGPGLAAHALEPLAREIARGMGTGARIESSAIVVQGDQRERLMEWLVPRGFPGVIAGN